MLIELSNPLIAVANIVCIPLVHILVAKLTNSLPLSLFHTKKSPAAPAPHSSGWIYEKLFFIRTWKDSLPDGGAWLNGFSKAKLAARSSSYLREFIQETRRGEFSHYLQALLILICLLWTPSPGSVIILLYAVLSNLPCILNQRYTRNRMQRVLFSRDSRQRKEP